MQLAKGVKGCQGGQEEPVALVLNDFTLPLFWGLYISLHCIFYWD